jgi:putative glycosyslhydrolase
MFNAFFPQLWLFYLFILIFLRTFAPNKIKTFMNSKKRYMVIALLALLVVSAMAYNDEAKPWTFWNWKYGSVSRPGIHADLTGMKNVGMGGIWLMPVREAGEHLEFQDGVAQLSPEFWKMMDYSFQLADSLDFDMGIHVLPGNPFVLPAESMQKVVWTDTIVKGGKKIEGLQMWQPESYKDGKMQSAGSEGGYYQDIAAFAIRFKGKTGPAWRNATDSAARSEAVPMTDVLPLKMEGGMVMGVMVNGILQNKLPKGSWCLLRMGHTSTGQTHATDGKGMGLEVDRFSPSAVKKLFDSWYAPLLNRPHGDVVSYLYIDPREWGSQNWGCQFAEEFKVRRGYDLIPYLPVMAGVPLESASRYEQVQNDIRLTIEELVKEKFFQTFTRLAEEQYVEVSCAPIPRTDHPDDMFRAVSRAHIYNENPVQAVACTGNYGARNGTPALLKPLIDSHLALGINRFIFQHDIVRHPEARGFMDYITMCQHYLQQGRPVVDIAVFHPSENPEQKNSYRAPRGYKYDLINKDALLKWNFEYSPKGKLPGNQDYRILVVSQPDSSLSAEIKAKLEELREEGIVIIDKPYQVKNFSQYGIDPDVILPENMDYAHRLVLEATGRKDIYFLINQENKERQITATFRTGTSRIRQIVNLNLPAYGSVFVILSNRDDMQIISPAKLPLP